ncbi:MAG: cyclic pyranopterin monophosphate synthase MoaC [Anaerolineales bacterium]
MPKAKLSHVDEGGRARMVDVGDKPASERLAVAAGEVRMLPETLSLITNHALKKGDALAVAQVAGIQAAKRTAELVPFCHMLPLDHISVDFELDGGLPGVRIRATVRSMGKTGVEMEALTAVTVAALTIYDMAKSAQKSMRIENIRLVKKSGGKSGDYAEDEVK